MAGKVKELNFSSGVVVDPPIDMGLDATAWKQYANDAAYEVVWGTGIKGSGYFNTSTNVPRYHNGTIWNDYIAAPVGSVIADAWQQYASNAAYEVVWGAGVKGSSYFNTSTNVPMVHNGTSWGVYGNYAIDGAWNPIIVLNTNLNVVNGFDAGYQIVKNTLHVFGIVDVDQDVSANHQFTCSVPSAISVLGNGGGTYNRTTYSAGRGGTISKYDSTKIAFDGQTGSTVSYEMAFQASFRITTFS